MTLILDEPSKLVQPAKRGIGSPSGTEAVGFSRRTEPPLDRREDSPSGSPLLFWGIWVSQHLRAGQREFQIPPSRPAVLDFVPRPNPWANRPRGRFSARERVEGVRLCRTSSD